MDSDTLKSIKILALRSAEHPTYEDYYRRICRWFSGKYATPLKIVEGYAEEYVLRHYFEEQLWSLAQATDESSRQAYLNIRAEILTSEEEKAQEEAAEENWITQLEREVTMSQSKYNRIHKQSDASQPQEMQNSQSNPLNNEAQKVQSDPNLITEGFFAGETGVPPDTESVK